MGRVTNRGVGYCLDMDCDEFIKGNFLMNHSEDRYFCPRCRVEGHVETERGASFGEGDMYWRVEVEFHYDPLERRYKSVAIVQDETADRDRVWKITTPLIKTEKRALKVAEAVLANLRRYDVPKTYERHLDICAPWDQYRKDLIAVLSPKEAA